jgi:hypothetical protein
VNSRDVCGNLGFNAARRWGIGNSAALPASLPFTNRTLVYGSAALYLMELRNTRKPRSMARSPGARPMRDAELQLPEERDQKLPPRNTRKEPDDGPEGSVTEPLG